MSKYKFISAQAGIWTISDLCRVLGVSRSGYYQWQAALVLPAPAWQPAAQQAFTRHAGRYDTRRLRAELRAEGHHVGCAARQRALSTRRAAQPTWWPRISCWANPSPRPQPGLGG